MSRRDRLTGSDPFERDDNSRPTLQNVDAELFGDLARVDAGRIQVKPVSVSDIVPDVTQPRRVIPSLVRGDWAGDLQILPELFDQWIQQVEDERGGEFPLSRYLRMEDEESGDSTSVPGPLETALLEIVRLAASIRSEGLTNPVTVCRVGRQYHLETGERRWLAYHLLRVWSDQTPGEDPDRWQRIPARIMDEFSVWRQASENNARANLNAIARARQFSVLLMDLYQQRGASFESYDTLVSRDDTDRIFYAQVADGDQYRIPRGMREQVLAAMGLKHPRQLSYYRQLLSLPDEAWRIADDYNLSENTLRECRMQAGDDDGLLVQLVVRAAQNAVDTGTTVPVSPPQAAQKPTKKRTDKHVAHPAMSKQQGRQFNRMVRLLTRINIDDVPRLETKARHELREWTGSLREWLDQLESALDDEG